MTRPPWVAALLLPAGAYGRAAGQQQPVPVADGDDEGLRGVCAALEARWNARGARTFSALFDGEASFYMGPFTDGSRLGS